ncbi:hypothetical protein [Streptomyces mangrovisoli]|uniref:hypothetical protein n=1 Tax=Streptomyces mangrovisoli TaxID=1428628 RepID=UPI00142E387A|nr:hypothetical protein [Streptomyces mangrovisoli]
MKYLSPASLGSGQEARPLLDSSHAPLGLFCGAWARSQRLGLREVRGPTVQDR